jgi:hypothetical protein
MSDPTSPLAQQLCADGHVAVGQRPNQNGFRLRPDRISHIHNQGKEKDQRDFLLQCQLKKGGDPPPPKTLR